MFIMCIFCTGAYTGGCAVATVMVMLYLFLKMAINGLWSVITQTSHVK